MSSRAIGREAFPSRPENASASLAKAPAISVIVPFWNASSSLDRCIECLLDQTLPRSAYEVLFVDNGSTDGGVALLDGYPDVRVFADSRRGSYSARNRALAGARGGIIAFTDADCLVERNWLEQVEAAMQAPEVGIVLGQRIASGGGFLQLVAAYESQKTAFVVDHSAGEANFGYTNCMAVRRSTLDELGSFLELDRGADTVLVRKAVDRYGSAVVHYRPGMRVTHLELNSLRAYYGKHRIYGQSNERLREHVRFRPLTARERWRVFRDTVRQQRRPVLSAPVLLACLLPGLVCYEWGRRITAFRRHGGDDSPLPTAPGRLAWGRLARPREWWRSKLPFACAAALLLAPGSPAARLLGMLAAVAALAAFGFGLNEIADLRSDARSGKGNRASGLTRASLAAFLLVSAGAAVWLAAASAAGAAAPLLILGGLALSAAYSVRPLRLKERGLVGIVAAAAAQWSVPVLAVATLGPGGWTRPATGVLALLGLAIGIRWMALHQLNDVLRDRVGGVRTYAALGGRVFLLIVLALAVEVPLLAALLVVARPQSVAAAVALGAWAVLGSLLRNPLQDLRRRLSRPATAPLANYYFTVLPLAMLLQWLAVPPGAWACGLLAAAAGVGLGAASRRLGRPAAIPPAAAERPPDDAVGAALGFIEQHQRADGGFDVVVGRDAGLRGGEPARCVFETAVIARILERWTGDLRAAQILQRGRAFLEAEREPSGLWRYFGRGSIIPADVDDTACAMLVLGPAEADPAAIQAILCNRGPDGPVSTWFLDPASGPPYRNCVDHSVVANVYALLRRRSIDAPEIRAYLQDTLVSRRYRDGTAYYPSPFFFLYALAAVAGDLDEAARHLEPEIHELVDEAGTTKPLEAALACTALVACGAGDERVAMLRDRIRRGQRADGGWPAEALCWGQQGRFWYGSRELTTAFCMEALAAR